MMTLYSLKANFLIKSIDRCPRRDWGLSVWAASVSLGGALAWLNMATLNIGTLRRLWQLWRAKLLNRDPAREVTEPATLLINPLIQV